MCPPSDSDRKPRNYYGYGANTLWFQYILCQQESIPSLACWLFTSGWNQAEFGQYYLYDNLLNSEDGGLLDGDLLPILAFTGGLGGGSHAPAHGGHPVYRRSASDCEEGDEGCVPSRKLRSSDCNDDEVETEKGCRKRRETTKNCKEDEVLAPSGCRKRRSVSDCEEGDEGCVPSRKLRSSECSDDEVETEKGCRKRRSVSEDCEEGQEGCVPSRKRRSSKCKDDELETDEGCRKRRETTKNCKEDEVLAPSGCRKRRSVSNCKEEDADGK